MTNNGEVIEFTCEICKCPFHELQGGRCIFCGKIVCSSHLSLQKEGVICSECLKLKKFSQEISQRMKRPMLISTISVLYLLAAMGFLIDMKKMGYIEASIFIIFCVVMGYGLWLLRKWARMIEILICYFQIFGVIFLLTLLIFATPLEFRQGINQFHILTVLLVSIAVISIYIVKYFKKPEIKEIFLAQTKSKKDDKRDPGLHS